MKPSTKINQFQLKLDEIVAKKKSSISEEVLRHLNTFQTISFTTFNNENVYEGELKNKIFFTYHDHYRGNSSTSMQVGELMHPHSNMDDRGYIKGVATDLDGYLKIRSANYLSHNLDVVWHLYSPHFQKSKHKEEYVAKINQLVKTAMDELNDYVAAQKLTLSNALKEMTGCSLLFYLRNI